jgi:ubiquinone/menaquinone biosynthesis C-methylase UbiE
LRTLKQSHIEYVFLEFDVDGSEKILAEKTTFSERIEWSLAGQQLNCLINNCGIICIAIIQNNCFNEYLECALACHRALVLNSASYGFVGKNNYFPRWGTLSRLISEFGVTKYYSFLIEKTFNDYIEEYLKRKSMFVQSSEEIDSYINNLKETDILVRVLSLIGLGEFKNSNKVNVIESTIYANLICAEKFKEIDCIPLDELLMRLMDGEMKQGRDDTFTGTTKLLEKSPTALLSKIKNKRGLEKLEIAIKSHRRTLKGKCIELGAGGGYFSSRISQLESVEECVAVDISMHEILKYGPIVWERFPPDWRKLRYMIRDFNKLDEYNNYFDVVVFCASLHHSSNPYKSLQVAYNLLKNGGQVILYGEHEYPIFFPHKKFEKSDIPHTIPQFTKLLKKSGFKPKILRYSLRGKRFPIIKKIVMNYTPIYFLNGIIRFAYIMISGVKN